MTQRTGCSHAPEHYINSKIRCFSIDCSCRNRTVERGIEEENDVLQSASASTARTNKPQTEYAVTLECQDCVDSVSKVLSKVPGINDFKISLGNQSVLVDGTVAPSKITKALRETGRAAILRGSGESGDGLGAAVCILDYNRLDSPHQDVRGLVRIVQLPSTPPRTFVEVTMASYPPGTYDIVIRETGNLTHGIKSAGQIIRVVGKVEVDERGWGEWSGEVEDLEVWQVVGHALSVDQVAGVVARSAGVWENIKKVCACSGRTIWEEHQVMAKQASVL